MRRYLLLVATLYPIAYFLFFMAVIGIAAAAGADPDHRVLWLVLVLLAGMLAMPVYWWLHMRPEPAATR